MRAYRVSFNAKTSKWVIEMMGLNLVFFTIWTPAKMLVEDEKGKKRHEVMTFDKADEAYAYVKEIGLDKVYKDVTGGMPWENHGQTQEADKPANQNVELANLLREVLANDRKAA